MHRTSSTSNRDLTGKTVRGVFWSALTFLGSKGVTFVSTIILARLLDPDEFGLMALGLVAIAYLDTFDGLGVGNVVIYKQDDVERNSSVAFTLNLIVNITLAIVGFVSAPLVADFFSDFRVTDILRVLSINLILSALGNIHQARLNKELKFKRSLLPEVGKTTAKAIVSISMAYMGFGVWSLVWGQVAANFTATSLYWIAHRWLPRITLQWQVVKDLLAYSSHLLSVDILSIISNNLDYLIIGRRFDTTSLGYYTMAYRLPELIIINVCAIVSRALFPAFSKIQDEINILRDGYLKTLRFVALYTVPVGIGFALVASEFILFAYGDQWVPAIPLTQVLSIYAIVYSLGYNTGDIYKATGRTHIMSRVGAVELVLSASMLWIGSQYGIIYVAIAHLISITIFTFARLIIVGWLIKIPFLEILKAIQPAMTGSLAMTLVITLLRSALFDVSPIWRLLVLVIIGSVAYIGVVWLVNREVALQGIGLFRRAFFKQPLASEAQSGG